jgi:hypothetical protein
LKKHIFLTIIFLFFCFPLVSQEAKHKWIRISGKWEVIKSQAFETQSKPIDWKYYEILNYNSFLSMKSFNDYSNIETQINIIERTESPAELMISFNLTSESQNWFYHMYAFKFTGGFWGINKASLIFSDRADKSKPFNTKNNTFIKELAMADCKIKYGKTYNYRIAFEEGKVVLYINGDKILSAPIPEKNYGGRIAISSRNAKIAVDKVMIKQNEKILFEDDFNEDSIYVKVLKVQRTPIPEADKDSEKKP